MATIALDAVGGDHAPDQIVLGAAEAIAAYDNVKIVLLGPSDLVKESLGRCNVSEGARLSIVHAPDIVDMGESPTRSFRQKKESSIRVGLELVKSGQAHAFVSAGNTGAVMTASTLVLGRINNVERPAIATIMPSKTGPFVMLDMGASVDSRPSHLSQFAVMGSHYAQLILGSKNPKVGLLNIGEEVEKGNQVTQATYELLSAHPGINFIGNVEGKHVLSGVADVVVADGFVGNSMLKFGEGAAELFFDFFKNEAKTNWLALIGLLLLRRSLKQFKKHYDFSEYGGAPLLGLNGVSVVAHGRSNANAIKNAVRQAVASVESQIVENMARAMA